MHIVQVVPYIGAESSGPADCIPRLCDRVMRQGGDVTLYTLKPEPVNKLGLKIKSFDWPEFPIKSIGRSPQMYRGLKDAAREADIIHNNSLWMLPNIYPEFARRGTNAKLVIMPHGTLSEYALNRSKWKKKISLLIGQRAALKNADMFIATAYQEYKDIRNYGLSQPVAIIPNGITIPDSNIFGERTLQNRMVFLSRIHPIKRVDSLIKVWSSLENDFPEWTLSIVGPINEYAREMIALSKSTKCERLTFEGELNGMNKFRFLHNSACFVLPTFSENFGIAVAEALVSGIPAITTKGAPWEGLISHDAGWWIDISDEALEQAMRKAMMMKVSDLWRMGENGREWMRQDFDWDTIGKKCLNAYRWLLGEIDKPDYILTD